MSTPEVNNRSIENHFYKNHGDSNQSRQPAQILSRDDLIKETLLHVANSHKRQEMEQALRNSSMPFYIDFESMKKYNLFVGGLLGGGPGNEPEAFENQNITFHIEDNISVTLERLHSGSLAGFYTVGETTQQFNKILINEIVVNNLSPTERKQVIPSLQKANRSTFSCGYDLETNTLSIRSCSRPPLKLIKGSENGEVESAINQKYSIIESLDEEYVSCSLSENSQIERKSRKFIEKYKLLLSKIEWDEERINILIRKATLDGLLITLISMWNYGELISKTKEVIEQFEAIEREIKLLNLSLNSKEALDFHMYRGFVFSKLPESMYKAQRKIAIADAMIIISCINQYSEEEETQPSRIFCKKMANAFKVFARGVDNPSVSLQFIDLGFKFIARCQKLTPTQDPDLVKLNKVLIELQTGFEHAKLEINLSVTKEADVDMDRPCLPQIIHRSTHIEAQLDEMEEVDQILFRITRTYGGNLEERAAGLASGIKEYSVYLSSEIKPSKVFMAKLRCLFLTNLHNQLIYKDDLNSLVAASQTIISDFQTMERSFPKDSPCQAEFYAFRGCVYITFPRFKEAAQYYDIGIRDFNKTKEMGLVLHDDIKAFQCMTYGENMLNNDPINAVKLLKQAVDLAHCVTVKNHSQEILNQFLGGFNPIRPSIQLASSGNLLKFS